MTNANDDQPISSSVPQAIGELVRVRWQNLPMRTEEFAQYARQRGIDLASIAAERGADLYLAFACFEQLPGAVEAFCQFFAGKIRAIGRSFGDSDAFADELTQRVFEKLFVARAPHPPGIGQYRAEAPLAAWLNTIARRAALRQVRSLKPEKVLDEDVLAQEVSETCDQELALLRTQHREVVREALVLALRSMPKREQRFLQLNLVAGVSMERIGKIYGISQSSVSRKIQRAIRNVIAAAKKEVRAKLRASSSEMESIFRLIQSCLDLTFTQFLEPADGKVSRDPGADSSAELPRLEGLSGPLS